MRLVPAVLVFLCSMAPGLAAGPQLLLSYGQPARDWQAQALPIGNGRLGAMVFGDAAREHIQLNEISLWTGDEKDTGQYQNLGDLFLDLPQGEVSEYRRELDIATATEHVRYRSGGVAFEREYFASYPAQVLVFRFSASAPGAYSGVLRLADAHNAPTRAEGSLLTASGALSNGLAYETQVRVVPDGGTVTALPDGTLRIDRANGLVVVVGAGTNYLPERSREWRGPRPHERVTAQVANAAATRYDALRAAHISDYQRLFGRVHLNLGATPEDARALPMNERLVRYDGGAADPELEALFFQYGRYLLISSSRGSLPANLQGLWNNSNTPPWRSDYHSNINVQMNYWPAEVTNLPECHLPFFNYVLSLREVRREATRNYYLHEVDPQKVERKAVRGWTFQTENNIFGAGSFKWNPPASAWYAQHFWEHYAFTGDRKFLRETAYPVLKEVCEFWEDHLVRRADGKLVTPDGWSPEHGPEEPGVTYDQEIVWDLFTNYLDAAAILGVDAAYRAKVAAMREQLLAPKVGRWGQLQEWAEDTDDPKDTHRHVSHLFALHPGRQISPVATPELARAAKVSLEARGDKSTGWAMAWRINFWARLLDGDHAHRLLTNLLQLVGKGEGVNYGEGGGVYMNLLDTHPPFQIDGNFGATAGIAEMLLQSQAGRIQLLPALPRAWADGAVSGLRARGNITVGMTWSRGALVRATLSSPEATEATVQLGTKTVQVRLQPGTPAVLEGQDLRRSSPSKR